MEPSGKTAHPAEHQIPNRLDDERRIKLLAFIAEESFLRYEGQSSLPFADYCGLFMVGDVADPTDQFASHHV